ncbi:hypothetical protein SCHPADRAFT_43740 [Schizopora paradoxa]|uniref:Uncharacterized protein n=1 Tax=Schizopora paradoxa TaxID=27342 RepID=A0A0H2SRV6_9AGAM|nr:hypothetical protein SCHPADRAFT_43740 [Schizopora paradoxa]
MPRLLPRLLNHLAKNPLGNDKPQGPQAKNHYKRRSLWKPRSSHSPTLFIHRDADERTRSLLLDSEDSNLLISPYKFSLHKTLPPKVKLNARQRSARVDHDRPREMTEEERRWWADPYLRMLSSPLRTCVRTMRLLPSDLLLRMDQVQAPGGKKLALTPNGVQHPRFSTRLLLQARYIACNKETVRSCLAPDARPHFHVEELQIGQLLRLRVLQELEMLAARLEAAPREFWQHTVLTRLTRDQWEDVKSQKLIPWDGAACVLVMPPPNRDSTTKTRPSPLLNDRPPSEPTPLSAGSATLPSVEMCLKSPSTFAETFGNQGGAYVPSQRIPLYHGVPLFPEPSHRAAIHEKLCQILKLEGKRRRRRQANEETHSKWSHAFLLNSTANTVLRADSVPLAIALWRLKLWEEGLKST